MKESCMWMFILGVILKFCWALCEQWRAWMYLGASPYNLVIKGFYVLRCEPLKLDNGGQGVLGHVPKISCSVLVFLGLSWWAMEFFPISCRRFLKNFQFKVLVHNFQSNFTSCLLFPSFWSNYFWVVPFILMFISPF